MNICHAYGFTDDPSGHSLGAGTAALVAIMLKPHWPHLKCFAFSPPGGLLSEDAARFSETFCMSVIIGRDIVPRMSLHTLETLKRQLVEQLAACTLPKVFHIKISGGD